MKKHIVALNRSETFLRRSEVATRWRCSGETIKRRQRSGLLHPILLSQRLLLYKLSEVEALEAEGAMGAKVHIRERAQIPAGEMPSEVGARR
jgi:hypothetical protein